jgi:phosphoglycolate phosphatase
MSPLDAVVFDLDGTLMDSKIDYEKMSLLIRDLLMSIGVTVPLEDRSAVYQVIRGGADSLLGLGLSEAEVPETLKRIDALVNSVELEALDEVELKPYVRETLELLSDECIKLGVATRGHREYAIKCLDRFALRGFFEGVLARDDVPYPKPDPRHLLDTIRLIGSRPETTLYIGDTTTDLETAFSAKVEFVGYWRDDEWAKRLMDGGCKRLIRDLREIVSMVKDS